jgi:signal transduction histidine kinase
LVTASSLKPGKTIRFSLLDPVPTDLYETITMTFDSTLNTKASSLYLRFVAGVLLAMAVALAVFYLVMRPQQTDLGLMALFLTITSAVTLIAGYTAYRSGWISRVPSLRWALLATYVLSSLLTFLNVWLTARLMFFNPHDLLMVTILLLFASGIAIALGAFFSEALSRRIASLNKTVQEVREKGLGPRAEVTGGDEIAQLAQAFNDMAGQLEDTARKQQELEALRRDLIAWTGHDLQTPLASVRAIVEALADGVVDDPETGKRYLQTAKREIGALSSLIDSLFEMATLDAGGLVLDLTLNSLADLISDTLESFSALAQEKGVELAGEVGRSVDPVMMDTQRIGRVLNNLVGNALRHTPTGGEVFVSAQTEAGLVTVQVCDSGPGLEETDLPFIFDRFYRGEKSRSRSTGGAGLGLAIAKGFVEAHGGEMQAWSASEGGAVFQFSLPKNGLGGVPA